MSLVRLDNVTKRSGGQILLDRINMRIEPGERIALIGRNGTGKTTIFRLIAGETEPDSGVVERMRKLRLAYLPQLPEISAAASIHEIALSSFPELLAQETELAALENQLHTGDKVLLQQYGEKQHLFTLQGGYEFRTRIRQILCGVGFHPKEFELPFAALSGGWRARLLLSLVLMQDADLLLLDEPENHLDMEAREWLEEHLSSRSEALLFISHDRRMVNNLAHRIIEVEGGTLTGCIGNYDRWMEEKRLRREQQQRAFERQEAFIQKEKAWIDRFRYKNTKARQAQNRLKRLEKLELVTAPPPELGTASFQLGEVARSGDIVLNAQALRMAYDGRSLYSGLSFSLHRGERLGIIGPNGSGKTTLLRHISGCQPEGKGTIWLGHNVHMALYDQHQESLNPAYDLLSEMQAFRPDWSTQQCRSWLGRFLFSGEDVFKPIRVLSGGERSRLALAKLIASDANVLLLDEPTNHLDIASREALEESLCEYEGTLIIVSHDRTLIDRLAERLIILRDGHARLFYGNFSDWRRNQENSGIISAEQEKCVKNDEKKNDPRNEKKASEREARRKQRLIEGLEQEIAQREDELADLHRKCALLDPADFIKAKEMKQACELLQQQINDLYDKWTAIHEAHP